MNRNFEKIIHHTQKWEGGKSFDPDDTAVKSGTCPTPWIDPKTGKKRYGCHTNKGITYAVWKKHFGTGRDQDFYEMSDENWLKIYMVYYNGVKGAQIQSDSIAFFLTQIGWGSGFGEVPGKIIQRALNNMGNKLVVDGKIGPATIASSNQADELKLFEAMLVERKKFFEKAAVGKNSKFLKGWLNRLNDFAKNFRPVK